MLVYLIRYSIYLRITSKFKFKKARKKKKNNNFDIMYQKSVGKIFF